MPKVTTLLAMFMFCLFAHGAWAQAAPVAERTVLFTCVDWDNANLRDLYFFTDGGYQPIRLRENRRSRQYRYAGEGVFRLYTRTEGAEGEAVYTPVAQLNLETLPDQILLLLTHEEGRGVRVYGIADTLERFPAGSYNVMNLTGQALDITVEERSLGLPPRGSEVVRVNGEPYRSLAVRITQDGNTLYSSTWIYEPNFRKVAFLLPRFNDERLEGLDVRIIPEVTVTPVADSAQ